MHIFAQFSTRTFVSGLLSLGALAVMFGIAAAAGAPLGTDKTEYAPGESVVVSWTEGTPGWVGFVPVGLAWTANPSLWFFVNATTSGSITLPAPSEPGSFEVVRMVESGRTAPFSVSHPADETVPDPVYSCENLAGDARTYCDFFVTTAARSEASLAPKPTTSAVAHWAFGRLLRSYVVMYEATENTYYLDKLIENIDKLMATRDDVRGFKDFTGTARACWSTIYGSQRYCEVSHNGFLSFPVMRFVEIVYDSPVLSVDARYKTKADEYLARTKEVVAALDFRWRDISSSKTKIKTDEGYYFWGGSDPVASGNRGWNLPDNQQLAMASTLLVLYDITGEMSYFDKARRMGRIFWRDLSASGSAYLWHYWWGSSLSKSAKYEDMGHAAIDVEYALRAYKQGFNVVNSTTPFPTVADMKRFATVFTNKLYVSPTNFNDRVNGGNDSGDGEPRRVGEWLDLAEFSPSIYSLAKSAVDANSTFKTSSDSLVVLAYARLTKWAVLLGQ